MIPIIVNEGSSLKLSLTAAFNGSGDQKIADITFHNPWLNSGLAMETDAKILESLRPLVPSHFGLELGRGWCIPVSSDPCRTDRSVGLSILSKWS